METSTCEKVMYEYIIPECNKKLKKYKDECGHSSIYGDEVTLRATSKWIYIEGTKPGNPKPYIYLKIRKCDQKLYSPSGKVGMCHYRDKECWCKKRAYFV